MNYTEFYLTKFAAASTPVVAPISNPVIPPGLNIPSPVVAPPVVAPPVVAQRPMVNLTPPSGSLNPPVIPPVAPPSFRKGLNELLGASKNTVATSGELAKKYGPKAVTGAAIATLGDAALRRSGTNPVVSSALTGAVAGQGFVPRNASPKTRAIAGGIGAIANAAKNLYTNSSFFLPNKAPVPAAPVPAPVPAPAASAVPKETGAQEYKRRFGVPGL